MPEIKIAVSGAGGRMGAALIRCLAHRAVGGLRLSGALESGKHSLLGRDAGIAAGAGETGVIVTAELNKVLTACDVLVDFTAPDAAAAHAVASAGAGVAMVMGTTGLSESRQKAVTRAAREIAVVQAANMSLGVNLLQILVRQAAAALKDRGYDCEIIERHHRRKKDAPSGTALALGRAVAEGRQQDLDKVARHGRQGLSATERPQDEIGFHAVRGGDIVGDHTVMLAADVELVELSHRAMSRDAFAVGALQAAAWCAGREAGLYSMRDVLGLD